MVEKGIISSIEGLAWAKVTVPTRADYVTEPLLMAVGVTALVVGDAVAFVEFPDLTGVILCKLEV